MSSIEEELKKMEEGKEPVEEKTSTEKGIFDKIWKAESPNKQPSEYINHALNWDKKDSTGRIIRGLEGLAGNLDRAILDVGIGICQKIGELFSSLTKKKPEQRD